MATPPASVPGGSLSSPPLVLPAPPPPPIPAVPVRPHAPPVSQATVERTYSYASSITLVEEPSVDDLKRDTSEVKDAVQSLLSSLKEIETLRDAIVTAGTGNVGDQLHKLAKLTTDTGNQVLELSVSLASVRKRADKLAQLARDGKAAATTSEVSMTTEELEVVKLECSKVIEQVHQFAAEEAADLARAMDRLARKIRAENRGMDEAGVEEAKKQAQQGAGERLSKLDLFSYAGRLAAENPFSELKVLIDTAAQQQRRAFSNLTNDSTATLRVGDGASTYEKVDNDVDLESAPLAPGQPGIGGPLKEQAGVLAKFRAYKNFFLRSFVFVACFSFMVAIIVLQMVGASREAKEDSKDAKASSVPTMPTVL